MASKVKKSTFNLAIIFTFIGLMVPVLTLASVAMTATAGLVRSVKRRKFAQAGIAYDKLGRGEKPSQRELNALQNHIRRHGQTNFGRLAHQRMSAAAAQGQIDRANVTIPLDPGYNPMNSGLNAPVGP